ncbi:MAG: hypothetical protein WC544_00245 [Patescibacteria group bacterium]
MSKKLSILLLVAVVVMALVSVAIAYPNPYKTAQDQAPGNAISLMNAISTTANDQSPPAITDTGPTISMNSNLKNDQSPASDSTITGTNGAAKNDEETTQKSMITTTALGNSPPADEIGLFSSSHATMSRAPAYREVGFVYIGDQGQAGSGLNGSMYTVNSNLVQQGNAAAVRTG